MNKTNIFIKLFSKSSEEEEPPLSQLIKSCEDNITEYDKKMIKNIIQLRDLSIKEIIVPRVDVVIIDIKSEINEILKIVDEKGHSRLPVYDKNVDNIIGVLHSKDLLKFYTKPENFELSKIIRQPLFVPESKMINDLLVEFREKRTHLAIVVDEYGGMSGIVCLEDIIEKIVGEIQDEFDNEVDDIQEIDKKTYLISSRITLDELNSRLGTDLVEDEIDTLGGIIFMLFGKIPLKNDSIEYRNYRFTVESIQGRKIKNIRMEIMSKEKNHI